jgi:hypothetical protein
MSVLDGICQDELHLPSLIPTKGKTSALVALHPQVDTEMTAEPF